MSNTTMVLGIGIATALFLTQKKGETKTKSPKKVDNGIIDPLPDHTVTDGTILLSGLNEIKADSQPNYENWQRKEWALWHKAILQQSSIHEATSKVWAAWQNQNNRYAFKFPTSYHLERMLILYQPKYNIGNIDITENSIPVYDTWTNWWNEAPIWSCNHWIIWFDQMREAWGKEAATQKFITAWGHSDHWASLTSGAPYCGSAFSCDFIQEMMNRGIDVALSGRKTLCAITNIRYNLAKAGENISEGIKETSSLVKNLTPIFLIGTALYYAKKISK